MMMRQPAGATTSWHDKRTRGRREETTRELRDDRQCNNQPAPVVQQNTVITSLMDHSLHTDMDQDGSIGTIQVVTSPKTSGKSREQ